MKLLNFKPSIDLAALSLRLFLGIMFFLHGIGKPLVVGMEKVTEGFVAHGLPIWTAYVSSLIEVVCGLMILLGYHSRLAALALLPVSIGILTYHLPNGWVFHNAGGGYEYPQLIIVSLVGLFFLGGGKYSLHCKS